MANENVWDWAAYDMDDDNGADCCSQIDVRADSAVQRKNHTGALYEDGMPRCHGPAGAAHCPTRSEHGHYPWGSCVTCPCRCPMHGERRGIHVIY